jgi:Methylase involved in ubiquinone/menaquinone biosynthesis
LYIELIDLLRCPRIHDESWLVAAFHKMENRFVIEGRLGCPICASNYKIRDGVADLRDEQSELLSPSEPVAAHGVDDEAMRVAAMLGLVKPGSVVVMVGTDADLAGEVSELSEARVIALNSRSRQSSERENVACVTSGARFPLAAASVDGVMLERGSPESAVAESIRVLKPGGRLVADAAFGLTGNLRELARDDRYVVAESTGPLLSLSR